MTNIDAIEALLSRPQPGVLAIIASVDGPSYRPVGAMMAIFGKNDYVGSLSSGCVEADIALHAQEALRAGNPATVLYGKGSPYLDIELPCGGGLEILLLPEPDLDVLAKVRSNATAREKCVLCIDTQSGALSLKSSTPSKLSDAKLSVEITPGICFYIFGKGPETSTFVSLVVSAGYKAVLLSPDDETLNTGHDIGCQTIKMTKKDFPPDLSVDAYSAIILFFHDHDWEPPILLAALETSAFYIGAQGSLKARETRFAAMRDMDATDQQLKRLHGPVGIIPSARDPVTLAVSVLAEIVGKASMDKDL